MDVVNVLRHEEKYGVLTDNQKRGFLPVPDGFLKNHADEIHVVLPKRGSSKSAGYDFVTPITVTINPGEKKLIWTDVCSYMKDDEVLELFVRSSVGIKKQLMLANVTGIIDSDYYANSSNFGNIGICLYNYGMEAITLEAGERIAQGIFKKYLTADGDETVGVRAGGIGSTGK